MILDDAGKIMDILAIAYPRLVCKLACLQSEAMRKSAWPYILKKKISIS
jgi:hypothetical protein